MYFAKLDIFMKVIKIIVANQDFIDGQPGLWAPVDIEGISPKNYPGTGDSFDPANNAYIAPKPFPSWILDASYKWQPPVVMPIDGLPHKWNEDNQSWSQ